MADALVLLAELRVAQRLLDDSEYEQSVARNGRRYKEVECLRDVIYDLKQNLRVLQETADEFLTQQGML